MSVEKQLKAISKLCTEKQKHNGISLLIKIFDDIKVCKEEQQTPRPIKIDVIVKKTGSYNFIAILHCAGYYKSKTNINQLIFDISKYQQLLIIDKEIRKFKDSYYDNSLSRGTIKLESISNKANIYLHNTLKVPHKLGSYRLQKIIGKGSFGIVYLCTDQRLKVFALKLFNKLCLNENEMESVLSEIKILSQIPTHPNTIKLIQVVEDDQFIGIVLPYFESGSLHSFIRDFGLDKEQINEELVISLITQILTGLEFLHKNNIIHRDIKGSNILISNDGVAKIADFGIAEIYNDKCIEEKEKEIKKINIKGSPYWMAPEIIEMQQVTPACDIWAIGATAIELFTGFPPYHNLKPMSALFRIVHDQHPKIPQNASALFKHFLLECFIKDPIKRPTASKLLNHKWLKTYDFNGFDY